MDVRIDPGGAASSAHRGLVAFDAALLPEVVAFQCAAYPTRRPDLVEPRWRWMFLASAARLGVSPMVWLYVRRGKVVAHQGVIPVELAVEGGRLRTGWFVETMALPDERRGAVGSMIVAKALEEVPFNLSLGQTAYMRQIQYRLGWKEVAALPTYQRILRGRRVLAGRFGVPGVSDVVGSMAETVQRVAALRSRPRLRHDTEVTEIFRFTEAHDELWRRLAARVRCAVVRDASYLNWKYVDQPGQSFVRLEVTRGPAPVAVVIFVVREPDDVYAYRRAEVLELLVDAGDQAAVAAAIGALVSESRDRDVDLVSCDLREPRLERALGAAGFVRRRPTRWLLVATGGLGPTRASTVCASDAWWLTRGDSDIDRPW